MITTYITADEAAIYFSEMLNTDAWDDATSIDRVKALKMASRILDCLAYKGLRTSDSQEHEFPRDGETEIPAALKEACADIALKLLDGVDMDAETENLGVESQGFGNVRTTYNRSFVLEYIMAGVPSTNAWRKIYPYLLDPNTVILNRV